MKQTVLSELAVYLPDYQPEEPFDDAGQSRGENKGEPGFGEQVTVTLKPVRPPSPSIVQKHDTSNFDDDGIGDDAGTRGGAGTGSGGGGGGQGKGGGQGGTETKGGGSTRRGVSVSRVRILPIVGRENCYRLSFVAEADGVVRLVRKLPRQVDTAKGDCTGGFSLGKNVRGGTRPRLSCGRSWL